jgi:hypothetical protein
MRPESKEHTLRFLRTRVKVCCWDYIKGWKPCTLILAVLCSNDFLQDVIQRENPTGKINMDQKDSATKCLDFGASRGINAP